MHSTPYDQLLSLPDIPIQYDQHFSLHYIPATGLYELHALPGASYTIATATSDDRNRPFSLLTVHEADTPEPATEFAVREDINPLHSHRALAYTSCCSILHLLDSLEDVHDRWLFDAATTVDSRSDAACASPTSDRLEEPVPPSSDDLQIALAKLSEITFPDHHVPTTGSEAACLLHLSLIHI